MRKAGARASLAELAQYVQPLWERVVEPAFHCLPRGRNRCFRVRHLAALMHAQYLWLQLCAFVRERPCRDGKSERQTSGGVQPWPDKMDASVLPLLESQVSRHLVVN
jgi:hypothetical protein